MVQNIKDNKIKTTQVYLNSIFTLTQKKTLLLLKKSIWLKSECEKASPPQSHDCESHDTTTTT
jgi:hypothetical protein